MKRTDLICWDSLERDYPAFAELHEISLFPSKRLLTSVSKQRPSELGRKRFRSASSLPRSFHRKYKNVWQFSRSLCLRFLRCYLLKREILPVSLSSLPYFSGIIYPSQEQPFSRETLSVLLFLNQWHTSPVTRMVIHEWAQSFACRDSSRYKLLCKENYPDSRSGSLRIGYPVMWKSAACFSRESLVSWNQAKLSFLRPSTLISLESREGRRQPRQEQNKICLPTSSHSYKMPKNAFRTVVQEWIVEHSESYCWFLDPPQRGLVKIPSRSGAQKMFWSLIQYQFTFSCFTLEHGTLLHSLHDSGDSPDAPFELFLSNLITDPVLFKVDSLRIMWFFDLATYLTGRWPRPDWGLVVVTKLQ